ncbi:hypothetical protein ACFTZB_33155 [Rhodococcus sp. NPDC057014]|uniref:hypothetical protein n=1 Tax=Rhodococcus sp. NPDC057014 TaxID=3346000 RepID=UPI00362A42B3
MEVLVLLYCSGVVRSQFRLSAWGVAVEVLAAIAVLVTVVLIVPAVYLMLGAMITIEQRRLGQRASDTDSAPTRSTRQDRG